MPNLSKNFSSISKIAIGKRIRTVRNEKKLSQHDFGMMIGVDQKEVSLAENGKFPTSRMLDGLVSQFGIDLNWLLAGKAVASNGKQKPKKPSAIGAGSACQQRANPNEFVRKVDVTPYVPTELPNKLDGLQVAEGPIEYTLAGAREQIMGQLRQAAAYIGQYDLVPIGRPRPQVPPVLRIVPAAANAAAGDSLAEIEAEGDHIVVVPILEAKVAAGVARLGGRARNIWECEIDGWAFCYAAHVPHPKDTHCLRIAGDSMAPVIPAGALVGIDHAIRDPRQMRTRLGHAPKALLRIEGAPARAGEGASPDGREDPGCVVRNIKLVGGSWLMGTPENASGEFPEFTFDLAEADTLNAVLGQVIWWFTSEL